jgi:hypothetical protein
LELVAELGNKPRHIARIMGLSHCAVIGKLDRIKAGEGKGADGRRHADRKPGDRNAGAMARGEQIRAAAAARREAAAAAAKTRGNNNNPTGITAAKVARVKQAGPHGIPPSAPTVPTKSFADIEHRQCRYIGERPEVLTIETLIFCGQHTNGGPWCPVHLAVVSQAPVPRRVQLPRP